MVCVNMECREYNNIRQDNPSQQGQHQRRDRHLDQHKDQTCYVLALLLILPSYVTAFKSFWELKYNILYSTSSWQCWQRTSPRCTWSRRRLTGWCCSCSSSHRSKFNRWLFQGRTNKWILADANLCTVKKSS